MLKIFICTDLSDKRSVFVGLYKITNCFFISFLSFKLNEFLQSEIKWKLFSLQKITCGIAVADKK